jgi:hypothetical protein
MDRLARDLDEDAVRDVRPAEPPAPEPVQSGSLAWASAIGNQAVQRLARESLDEPGEAEAEEVPPEVDALSAAGIGPQEAAGLDAVEDLAEDEIPE